MASPDAGLGLYKGKMDPLNSNSDSKSGCGLRNPPNLSHTWASRCVFVSCYYPAPQLAYIHSRILQTRLQEFMIRMMLARALVHTTAEVKPIKSING